MKNRNAPLARRSTRIWIMLPVVVWLSGCASLKNSPRYQLGDGYYDFRQKGFRYQKVFAYAEDDTVRIFSRYDSARAIVSDPSRDQLFLKRSFDIDVMTVGFKYRPGTQALPRQLTTDFNGNVFIGYRLDRFLVRYNRSPVGLRKSFHHIGFTGGAFFGIGSTAITPWTTNSLTTDEYNGFILSRGIALMIGLNTVTVGAGIGWDYLTDRDRDIWIYQHRPWFGLAVGLNVN